MVYVFAVISAIVSGALFALAARVFGVEQVGILFAIGGIGGGLQLIFLITWFLHHTRPEHASLQSDGGEEQTLHL